MSTHTRAEAWSLLTEWTECESLRKHALSVEAAMRHYARHFGEDEELWGMTGLLHDFDYEKYPDATGHPATGMAYLREHGWPEEMIHAIGGHATYLNVPRVSNMDKCLFASDELCGLIMAVAYVRPEKSLASVEVRSVLKKMKDKTFARGVNRDDVIQGAEELGISLEEHVGHCLEALQGAAAELGL
jgi:putative nucleotidyltransferase with HDIG domain